MEDREEEARELLDQLYGKLDDGGLNNWEQAMFDTLSWLLDGSDKPELD